MSFLTKQPMLVVAATFVPDTWLDAFARFFSAVPIDKATELSWAAVASAASALLVLLARRWFRQRRNRSAVVAELASRGHSVSQIARRLELPQDTIRQLLGPVNRATRRSKAGNSFRRKRGRAVAAKA